MQTETIKKVNSLCKNEWLGLCGSGLLYWCYQYLFQCILCFNINTIRFFSRYFFSCFTHKYRVSGWYSLHNHVKLEKEIYFPFSAKTQRVWCLTHSQVIFKKGSKSEDIWGWCKELCSTYHVEIYSWIEQYLILRLHSRLIWVLVNVYIWFKSLFLVLVKGQQLRHLVAHLFMNHWALY